MYKLYIYNKFGHLGRGNRIQIPVCVISKIREMWPEDSNEDYMGHRDE